MGDLITTVGTGESQSVTMFNFGNATVRVCKDSEGEPWFVAKDVCEYFGESNYRRAVSSLDQEEKGVSQINTPGGIQSMTVVNESGLYGLLFAMQPTKARGVTEQYIIERQEKLSKFKKWVTSEVLPEIRKNGAYVAAAPSESLEELTKRALQGLEAAIARQKLQLAEQRKQLELQAPDVEYCNEVLCANNLHTVNSIATHLGISAMRLNKFLIDEDWIYKQGGVYYPSSKIRGKNYADFHVIPYVNRDGETLTREHLKWTELGRRAIIDLWNKKKMQSA